MDIRDEVRPEPLTEERLPPKPPRMPRPLKRPRRVPTLPVLGVLAVLVLGVVGYALFSRSEPKQVPNQGEIESKPTSKESKPTLKVTTVEPAGFRSLFNGKDLTGWAGELEGYEVGAGAIRSKPGKRATIYYFPRQYSDFVARVEFRLSPGANSGFAIRYPGEGDPTKSGMCEIQILDDTAPKFATIDPRQYHGSVYGMVAAQRWHLRPVGEWNFQDVTVQGSKIKVELNGTVILDTDLGQSHDFMQPHPNKDRTSGYFGLTGIDGPVEFRKIEIRELNAGASPGSMAASLKSTRFLFVDDFNDPGSGWDKERADQRLKNSDEHHGYVDGLYRLDANKAGAWWLWSCPKRAFPEFTCEVVGRVYGDKPTSSGAMILLVGGNGHSFQVCIDTYGRLYVLLTGVDANAPSKQVNLGARSHPAIKKGPRDFNTIVLHMRKRRAEILVNGVRVCDPVTLDWNATPADLQLGIDCWSPNVRAEFDRIEVREVGVPAAAAREPASKVEPAGKSAKLDGAIRENPNDAAAYVARGEWYAREGRWKEAAADLAKATELKPTDTVFRIWLAHVLLRMDDDQGYRQLCEQKTKELSRMPFRPDVANNTVWLFGLGPNAAPEYNSLVALAERAVKEASNQQSRDTL